MRRDELVRRLTELLDEERSLVAGADPARLGTLAERKQDLLTRLEGGAGPVAPEAMERLLERARRNARLIDAARRGLRDAQALLDRLRIPQSHETYGPRGQRERHDRGAGRLEKRA